MVSRPCGNLFQGLSLVPRGSRNWLSKNQQFSTQHRISSTTKRCSLSTGSAEHIAVSNAETKNKECEALRNDAAGTALESSLGETRLGAPSTSNRQVPRKRDTFRHVAKTRLPSELSNPLITPATRYPSRRASHNALRKQVAAARRLSLTEYIGEELGKPKNTWSSTLSFMLQHTPEYSEVSDFRIGIEKGEILLAHATLREFEAEVWELRRKHECKVRIESNARDGALIILSLSGTNISIRELLSELVRIVGKISAVKVLDERQETSLLEDLGNRSDRQYLIPPPDSGEHGAKDEKNAVFKYIDTDLVGEYGYRRRSPYKLTQRADHIPRPAVWTEDSFEQYVADLVFAQVPAHLNHSLYPVGKPDHQSTVVGLLTELFTSEDLQSFISAPAVKMALSYINKRGSVFLPEARTIFYQAELRRLVDAETFQSSLAQTSQAGNLRAFRSALGAMCKRGHYVGAGVWKAFLKMVKDPVIKLNIMNTMRSRRLHLLPSVRAELGRQTALIFLRRPENRDKDIRSLLAAQNRTYGTSWLNTMTINQMLDILGAHGNLGACDELLEYMETSQRARPDQYTLNIMMTHTRSIPRKIALLSRWPELRPDAVSYQLLFSTAWRQRLPNMLGVVWRYSVFAGHTSFKMRQSLTMLVRPQTDMSKRMWSLKAWEDVVFGRDVLAAGRLLHIDNPESFGAWTLMKQYMEDAGERRPLVGLGPKLQEAYEMDMKIKNLQREGGKSTSSGNLAVEIPLGVPGEGIIALPKASLKRIAQPIGLLGAKRSSKAA